ncbi:Protein CBG16774 [Caenorhabditis briggsae]|uniref:histone acetyltransferase n=1 Tax=Caenorhabditis briggsae TaxID=6238 RepID=A8XPS7_CAEBR|nr:Protein CBG16774 [Caenorhabditis briggsae]CAP34653.2 Protein CBG16774 [Caenorhabditis briggsae]
MSVNLRKFDGEVIFYNPEGIKTAAQWSKDRIDFSSVVVSTDQEELDHTTVQPGVNYSVYLTADELDANNTKIRCHNKYLGVVLFSDPEERKKVNGTNKRKPTQNGDGEAKNKKMARNGREKGKAEEEGFLEEVPQSSSANRRSFEFDDFECCDKEPFYRLDNFSCAADSTNCRVNEGDTYFALKENGEIKREWLCKKHFDEMRSKGEVGSSGNNRRVWLEHLHDHREYELKKMCSLCSTWKHVVCENFCLDEDTKSFVCQSCDPLPRKMISAATALHETYLSKHMEKYCKRLFDELRCSSTTSIRLIASGESDSIVPEGPLTDWFNELKIDLNHPFVYKHIGVFQQSTGPEKEDMFMFSMMVREYVNDGPKKGTTFLYYLDTNQRCSPSQFRSKIYQKLLASYWDYARSIGFWKCFVYMSAPRKGDDYLFSGHPANQNYLTDDHLYEWYQKAVESARREGTTIYQPKKICVEENETVAHLADRLFYENGLWPDMLKVYLDEREEETGEEDFIKFVEGRSEVFKNSVFFVDFYPEKPLNIIILDRDQLYPSKIAGTRESWIDHQLEQHLQFDTERKTKYSTQIQLRALVKEREENKNGEVDEMEDDRTSHLLFFLILMSFKSPTDSNRGTNEQQTGELYVCQRSTND